MVNKLTASYSKALELHNKILVSAQLAQNNLWEMCSGLKEMRDGKLYKELGYKNFEDYCQTEHSISRQQAHKYISIIENINPENVNPGLHFGVRKLYLLSTLSESEQEQITTERDVESLTVKKLEAEIKNLRMSNGQKKSQLQSLNDRLNKANEDVGKYRSALHNIEAQNDELREQIKDLEARPVEVAVAEPSEDVRQLKLTIKNLERTSEEQLDRVQEEHLAVERRLRQDHAKELESKLTEQAQAYEQKLAEVAQAAGDDKQVFKAYFTAAYDAFNRMLAFAEKSSDKLFFQLKITNLLNTLTTANKNM